jgi:hypothetical protein
MKEKEHKIELVIECPACNGTGVYQGMCERGGTAVICHRCDGTGAYTYRFEYNLFQGRQINPNVDRVYESSYDYVISTGILEFKTESGPISINMDKEGVSYKEFLQGKMPKHIESLRCPLRADQDACHKIKGFVDECESLNGGWIGTISSCKYQPFKHKCWERFNATK